MDNYVLSCCSTADLTKAHFDSRNIRYICFHYALGDTEYPDDLGQTVSFDEFYRRMEAGEMTRTSQVNVEEFVDYFTPFLEAGQDIVHVCLSSGISGVSNSANAAAALLREKYPQRKLYIVDSLGASSGYGLLMDKLADLRDGGLEVRERVVGDGDVVDKRAAAAVRKHVRLDGRHDDAAAVAAHVAVAPPAHVHADRLENQNAVPVPDDRRFTLHTFP